jgi:hypothetical protein
MDDLIREARDAFKECKEADQHNHDDYLEDVRFARLGEQWDKEIRQQRELEHRPILTVNKLAPIIRQVVNDSRQNKPSIKVHPVDDDADPETAELISGLISTSTRRRRSCSTASASPSLANPATCAPTR